MKKMFYLKSIAACVAVACCASEAMAQRTIAAAIGRGTTTGQFNLRYEGVDEDNPKLLDTSALTLRTAIKYTTGTLEGFTGVVEVEDVRYLGGMNDFSVPQTGYHTGIYSTIADPEVTEVNQGYLQYVNERITVKAGRQDIRYDNQRFVGAVPWRQDYQTFDGVSFTYKNESALTVDYNYLMQRNRIFAQAADIDSKDHLIHLTYPTPIGSLVGYGYLLKEDIVTDNKIDTWGLRLTNTKHVGSIDALYTLEWATQDWERGVVAYDADYYNLEVGAIYNGITGKIGIESLGSDQGKYGFATPLATLHLFQGWADQFLNTPVQGIEDKYLSVAGTLFTGTYTVAWHDYKADESAPGVDDMGSEWNLQWTLPIKNNYVFGVKYANYDNGDYAAKLDKSVFWTWFTINF